jgi:hypothetical protein
MRMKRYPDNLHRMLSISALSLVLMSGLVVHVSLRNLRRSCQPAFQLLMGKWPFRYGEHSPAVREYIGKVREAEAFVTTQVHHFHLMMWISVGLLVAGFLAAAAGFWLRRNRGKRSQLLKLETRLLEPTLDS